MVHFDTNFLIAVADVRSFERSLLNRWTREGQRVGASAIAWAEFLCGPLLPGAASIVRSVIGEPVAFTAADAAHAAELYNSTGRRRGSLNDCMIAAIALRSDAAVATKDAAHFRRFASLGLRIAE